MVKFKTAQIIYKAKNNMLPKNIQKLLKKGDDEKGGRYELRWKFNLNQTNKHKYYIKKHVSLWLGVKQWCSLPVNIKVSNNIAVYVNIQNDWMP